MHTDFLSGQKAHKGHYGDEIKFVTLPSFRPTYNTT